MPPRRPCLGWERSKLGAACDGTLVGVTGAPSAQVRWARRDPAALDQACARVRRLFTGPRGDARRSPPSRSSSPTSACRSPARATVSKRRPSIDHEGMFGVRVDRDVPARSGFAVGLQPGGVLGRAEQSAAVQRVGDRARAVIALGLKRAVAAAVHVRPGRDFIGGRDHAGHDARGFAFAAARCWSSSSRLSAARCFPGPGTPCQGADGGVSVLGVVTPITLQVAGPTTPSTVSPWRACRRSNAASVSGPKSPSRADAALPAAARPRCRGDLPLRSRWASRWRRSARAGRAWSERVRRPGQRRRRGRGKRFRAAARRSRSRSPGRRRRRRSARGGPAGGGRRPRFPGRSRRRQAGAAPAAAA